MKKSRFAEAQIAFALRQAESGARQVSRHDDGFACLAKSSAPITRKSVPDRRY